MCSGGDCAGMNPAIKKFVDYSFDVGQKPYLIYDGLEGLIDNNIKEATHKDVAGILHYGGTILRSSRSKRFFDIKYREIAFNNLKEREIDKLVVLGGDGSFRALNQFHLDFDINFVGVPSTIDNDIYGTEYCLGVDTALNIIRDALDDIRDTASSFKRGFVVEVMGRDCGYLALVSAIASGAEICIIPESDYDLSNLQKRLKDEMDAGRQYILAVVAEGTNSTTKIANWLESEVGIETRVTILGHVQRGGNPTLFDRLMAFEFVTYAIDKLISEESVNRAIVYNNSKFDFIEIEEITANRYRIKPDFIKLAQKMLK